MESLAFTVRAGRADDVGAVDALLQRSYPRLLKRDYKPSVLVTAIPLISRAQPALITCGTYYVAEAAEGAIIGAGGWTLRNPASGREYRRVGNIRHFATDPDHVRQGVAGRLMHRCLLDARDARLEALHCYSTLTAVPFYRSQGFEVLGDVEIELQPGIMLPAVSMHRRLRG